RAAEGGFQIACLELTVRYVLQPQDAKVVVTNDKWMRDAVLRAANVRQNDAKQIGAIAVRVVVGLLHRKRKRSRNEHTRKIERHRNICVVRRGSPKMWSDGR